MAKKINHRERGGHRELLFSLCPLFSLWFSEPIPEDSETLLNFTFPKIAQVSLSCTASANVNM